jgi:hypothetical protein
MQRSVIEELKGCNPYVANRANCLPKGRNPKVKRRRWTKPENLAYTDFIFFVFKLGRLAMRFYGFRELIATDTP